MTSFVVKPQPYVRPNWFARNRGQLLLHLAVGLLTFLFRVPLWVVVSASFTDETALTKVGYGLWPAQVSLAAYNFILQNPTQIVNAYGVTALVTAIGTVASLFINSLTAYVLARVDFTWRRPFSFLLFFTMLFNGGLVPSYILITQYLKLRDTIWVLILPMLLAPWYIFLLRTYFSTLSKEYIESARLDGANEWQILFQVVLPMAMPVVATAAIITFLLNWSQWLPILVVSKSPATYTLPVALLNLNGELGVNFQGIMAMSVLTTLPVILFFLLAQRRVMSGMTAGAVKG